MKKVKMVCLAVMFLALFVSGAYAGKVEKVCNALADVAEAAYNAGYVGEDCNALAIAALQAGGADLGAIMAAVTKRYCDMGLRDMVAKNVYRGKEAHKQAYSLCFQAMGNDL